MMEYLTGAVAVLALVVIAVFRIDYCELIGHVPPIYKRDKGWGGTEYGKLVPGGVDGVGRLHGTVTGKCARCGEEFKMAMVHVPYTKRGIK